MACKTEQRNSRKREIKMLLHLKNGLTDCLDGLAGIGLKQSAQSSPISAWPKLRSGASPLGPTGPVSLCCSSPAGGHGVRGPFGMAGPPHSVGACRTPSRPKQRSGRWLGRFIETAGSSEHEPESTLQNFKNRSNDFQKFPKFAGMILRYIR
jgi:hypothetical protein